MSNALQIILALLGILSPVAVIWAVLKMIFSLGQAKKGVQVLVTQVSEIKTQNDKQDIKLASLDKKVAVIVTTLNERTGHSQDNNLMALITNGNGEQ